MAKKSKGKKMSMLAPVAGSVDEYKPQIHIDLDDDDADQMDGLKVDETVTVHVTGKVVGISKRKPYKGSDKEVTGTLDVEIKSVEVEGGKTEFEELADDKDEDDDR